MTASPAVSRLSGSGLIVAAAAAVLAAGFCVFMWDEWTGNPDLSHGLFAPVLFVLLLAESRRRGPWRYPSDSPALSAMRGLGAAAGLVFVGLAGLYAAAVEWSHPLVSLCLALSLSSFMAAALAWFSRDRVRVLPLNWSSLVAAGLWPLCVPLPPGTYSRLTLRLQFWVTDIVLDALHLLGVAASKTGNVIQLAHATVGVEEACSGVRSLLSCVVAAVFFSATLVRRPWARVLLIALAPPLAFVMNIVRSLVLTLMANSGIDISGSWHDLTGFAVLGVTALMLGGLALALEDNRPSPAPAAAGKTDRTAPLGLLATCGVTALLLVFFAVKTRAPSASPTPPPDLAAILPAKPPGWDAVQTPDLYQFAPILKTDHLAERSYLRAAGPGHPEPLLINVYLAYWSPGQARVSLVAAHTPDACWPGGGWSAGPAAAPPVPFLASGRPLPAPEYRAFSYSGQIRHVWYWHLYDGRSIAQGDPRSAVALLKLAWSYGFRSAGEQMFVRVSSNRPWEEIRDDPLVARIFAELRPRGL